MSVATTIVDYVATHPQIAYGMTFALALSEAIPILGAVVPGSALIIGIAALVPTGAVKLWPLMVAAVLGAIAGDGLSFWLGHRYQDAILLRWPLNHAQHPIEKSRAFLQRHGGKSVFLARFLPAVRAFVPLAAGILQMPMRHFYVANVLSALVWAPAHILPGVLVGASFSLAGPAAGRLVILLVVLLVLLWIGVWATRLAVRQGPPLLAKLQQRLWLWAGVRDTWLRRHVRALVDPDRTETRALVMWAAVVLAGAGTFFAILEDVVTGDPLVRADVAVYHALQDLRTPLGNAVMIAITEMGDTAVTLTMTLVILAWLVWQGARRTAAYWVAAVGFAAALNTAIKAAIHRARPGELAYSGVTEFSFPSGHATVNAVMYGFLAFLIVRQLKLTWRVPVVAAVVAFTLLIAVSRLYLGAHWFSDVAGSLTFAAAWLIAVAVAYVRHRPPEINVKALAAVACISLAAIGGFNIHRRHGQDTQRYAVTFDVPTMRSEEWRAAEWTKLPAYRLDLTGELEEPLTFQWAGSLQELERRLAGNGWRRPAPWSFRSASEWLTTNDAFKLPVLPRLQAGRLPSFTMIGPQRSQPSSDSRNVLSLWSADVKLENGRPIWIGSIVEERMFRALSMITIPIGRAEADRPRASLAQALGEGMVLVQRVTRGSEFKWDRRVLLGAESEASPGEQQQHQQHQQQSPDGAREGGLQ